MPARRSSKESRLRFWRDTANCGRPIGDELTDETRVVIPDWTGIALASTTFQDRQLGPSGWFCFRSDLPQHLCEALGINFIR